MYIFVSGHLFFFGLILKKLPLIFSGCHFLGVSSSIPSLWTNVCLQSWDRSPIVGPLFHLATVCLVIGEFPPFKFMSITDIWGLTTATWSFFFLIALYLYCSFFHVPICSFSLIVCSFSLKIFFLLPTPLQISPFPPLSPLHQAPPSSLHHKLLSVPVIFFFVSSFAAVLWVLPTHFLSYPFPDSLAGRNKEAFSGTILVCAPDWWCF